MMGCGATGNCEFGAWVSFCGRYSGPVCPQPARFSTPASAHAVASRFCEIFNMVKL